jgi:D-sedoheptulose 7-phosphate isomerase
MEEIIRFSIVESIQVKTDVLCTNITAISQVAGELAVAFRAGGKVVLFGNGGSAADAQHVAAELVNRFLLERDALPAIALTTDTSVLTSLANDVGCVYIFVRQIEALVREGDLAIGLSTSGTSANVIEAIIAAKKQGARTVALTGCCGGKLGEVADLCICVPSESTPRIQEAHLTILHAICQAVEEELFGVGAERAPLRDAGG